MRVYIAKLKIVTQKFGLLLGSLKGITCMVFSSLVFLYIFLPINLVFYFIIKNKTYRNTVLVIFSLLFYAYGEPLWVFLLIFTTIVDYTNGRLIEKFRDNWKSKAAFIASLVISLSILVLFKYSAFFMTNVNSLLSTNLPYREFLLPLGISFYTFQSISYVIDVYKGDVKAQTSYLKYLLFVSLFHQLVAGPVVRYADIANDINNRKESISMFGEGVLRFVTGLLKKIVIANTAGEIGKLFLDGNFSALSVLGAWFGIAMFTIQIYFDFSGYSDMAIGLGKMFGFTYKENFNYPYTAKSATDFWRRWHISLSSFFRDYLYIPLGGNKKWYLRNIFIVWFLTGLWHGASWNFIFWGLFYGLFILLEKVFLHSVFAKLPTFFSHLYLVFITLIGWTLFYFTDLKRLLEFTRIMFGMTNNPLINANLSIAFTQNVFFLLLACVLSTPLIKNILSGIEGRIIRHEIILNITKSAYVIASIILVTILLTAQSYNPFLYFRF